MLLFPASEAQLKLSIKEDCTGSQKFREVRPQAGRDTEKEFIFSSLASGFALLWDRLPLDSNRDHPWALQAKGCLWSPCQRECLGVPEGGICTQGYSESNRHIQNYYLTVVSQNLTLLKFVTLISYQVLSTTL